MARCAQSPQGIIGIAFGFAYAQTGFIPAEAVEEFCVANAQATGDHAVILELVRDAAAGLGAFRHTLRTTASAQNN